MNQGAYVMNFLRSRILLISTIVLSVFALIAVIISVRVSIAMVEKKNHRVTDKNDDIYRPARTDMKPAYINKMIEISSNLKFTFFFNGQESDNVYAYLTGGKEVLLPLDFILQKAGIKFYLYNPDDMLQADINGKKLLIKFEDGSIYLDGIRMTFGALPVVAKNGILVPAKLFTLLDGFEVDEYPHRNTVFINYHRDYKTIEKDKYKIITQMEKPELHDTEEKSGIKADKDKISYLEFGGGEKAALELPWNCDFLYSVSEEGPYIAVSAEEDGVFYITRETSRKIGQSTMFPNNMTEKDSRVDYGKNILGWTGSRYSTVFQVENGFVELVVIDSSSDRIRRIVLNYPADSIWQNETSAAKWLSNDRLLLCADCCAWIVDLCQGDGSADIASSIPLTHVENQ